MANELGVIRRSALVSPYGPGAIVDFRAGGGPVSGVVAGLEEWDRSSPAGLRHPQVTYEPRLQVALGVHGFRLPPVAAGDRPASSEQLVAVRFPSWLVCPGCSRLRRARRWGADPGSAARYCGECSANRGTRTKMFAIPARFVVACGAGHLDEFPWHWWVTHRDGCGNHDGDLRLESRGAGLAGLILSCNTCQSSRSMEGVFGGQTLAGLRCTGTRPWLASGRESCEIPVRALQRGASNLYFPITRSSLDIPPWSDHLQAALGQYWHPLSSAESSKRPLLVSALWSQFESLGYTQEALVSALEERIATLARQAGNSLRDEEYRQFTSRIGTAQDQVAEFECRPHPVPSVLGPWIGFIAEVVRLREVRALIGFTRINPPGTVERGVETVTAPIQDAHRDWLPAIEVRGEGVFLALDSERLARWESSPEVQARAAAVRVESPWAEAEPAITAENVARGMLTHTLSHVLMRQLALDCGYSAASLRERLYVGPSGDSSAGILIYTSSPDADGTLGGLSRQGHPDRLPLLVQRAVTVSQWCSSDPLCMSGASARSGAASLAACHSCALAPETSCELFNRLLDRAMLVGTPEQPNLGYFHQLLAK